MGRGKIGAINAHSASPAEKERFIIIINHLKLTFVAERPPPPHIAYQELSMAAVAPAEYLS